MPPKRKDGKKGDKKGEESLEDKLDKEITLLEGQNVDVGLELSFLKDRLKQVNAEGSRLEKEKENLTKRVASTANDFHHDLLDKAESLGKYERRLHELQEEIDGLNQSLHKKNEELHKLKDLLTTQDLRLKDATGGRVLLLHGGHSGRSDQACSKELCMLNLDHLTWERPLQEGVALSGHSENVMNRTTMLLFGGLLFEGLSAGIITFNTETMKWATLAAKNTVGPQPRAEHASVMIGEKLYVFGGINADGDLLDDFWSLDLDTMCWSQVVAVGALPSARKGASLCTKEDGRRIYLFGGFDGVHALNDVYAVDVDQTPCAWTSVHVQGPSPEAREGHTATVLGKYMLVAGGFATGGTRRLTSTHVLSLTNGSNMWECLDDGSWAGSIVRLKPFSKYMCFFGNKLFMLKPNRDEKLTELQMMEIALPEDIDRLRNQKKRDVHIADKLELLDNPICGSKFIEVSWRPPTKNSGRIDRFKLMIATNTGMVREVCEGKYLKHKVGGLKPSTEYILCVKAIYDDGSFLWSDSKAFYTKS